MISVDDALSRVLDLAKITPVEHVPLLQASGRILAEDVSTTRDQPPFAASAMDGYAILEQDYKPGQTLTCIGEAAAGVSYAGAITQGQCLRIFTGAPLPEGATRVVIQEDVKATGDQITIESTNETSPYVRPAGADFKAGMTLTAPLVLTPQRVALLASMNIASVPVRRKPVVSLISTGSELVMPGEIPRDDQIIASNTFGLHAMLTTAGAQVRLLPIAHDTEAALRQVFKLAKGADLIVTIGGASVGDHDLVGKVAADLGLERAFYKIAMRPGKPLMAGNMQGAAMVGLPGNPVSAMVCGTVFLKPLVRAMLGLGRSPEPHLTAQLTTDLTPNGPRAHYMRARIDGTDITPFHRQDSALLSVLSDANALLFRPPHDPAQPAGATVTYIPL